MKVPAELREKIKLLFGPYAAPPLKRGARAHCLYRDRLVVITSWSDAPISWPRGYAPSGRNGRGTGLLVDDELARAVQHESALAVCYWWRIGRTTVAKWRKALAVTKTNNEGTNSLVRAAAAKARAVALEVGITEEERKRRSRLMRKMKLWRLAPRVTFGTEWTHEAVALLGRMPDPQVARRTGHTLNAVHLKRRHLGIRQFREHPPRGACFEPRTGRWYASISIRGKRVHLGTFATEQEARRAYREVAEAERR